MRAVFKFGVGVTEDEANNQTVAHQLLAQNLVRVSLVHYSPIWATEV
jgi:hypothetical protein